MKKQKRKHTPEFKARIAFEAIQGIKTQHEIAKEYEIHPITVSKWKNELLSRMPEIFATENPKKNSGKDREKDKLQRKIGQLTMEVDFLEKKVRTVGNTGERAAFITPDVQLSIRQQCKDNLQAKEIIIGDCERRRRYILCYNL